jgi:hypothetical protein
LSSAMAPGSATVLHQCTSSNDVTLKQGYYKNNKLLGDGDVGLCIGFVCRLVTIARANIPDVFYNILRPISKNRKVTFLLSFYYKKNNTALKIKRPANTKYISLVFTDSFHIGQTHFYISMPPAYANTKTSIRTGAKSIGAFGSIV